MERESTHVMHDVRHAGPPRRDASQEAGLRAVRVDDLKPLLLEQPVQLAIGLPIAVRADRPVQRVDRMPADAQPIEFFGQWAGPLTGNVNLEPRAIELLEDLKHRTLHTAQERQNLEVADANHGICRR